MPLTRIFFLRKLVDRWEPPGAAEEVGAGRASLGGGVVGAVGADVVHDLPVVECLRVGCKAGEGTGNDTITQ